MCVDRAKEAYEMEQPVFDRLNCGWISSALAKNMTRRVCDVLGVTGPELYLVHPQAGEGHCAFVEFRYDGETFRGALVFNPDKASRGTIVHEIAHWITRPECGHCKHWAWNVVKAAVILWPNKDYWRWFEAAYAPLFAGAPADVKGENQ